MAWWDWRALPCSINSLPWPPWAVFAGAPAPDAPVRPITILKPLHGAEPRLAENLAGFTRQDYDAPSRSSGHQCPDDGAAPVARAMVAAHDNIAFTPDRERLPPMARSAL
jgi:ceramide glucosyltransferase